MMHLRGHPNIVSIYGLFEDEDSLHIVEEICTGVYVYGCLCTLELSALLCYSRPAHDCRGVAYHRRQLMSPATSTPLHQPPSPVHAASA